MKEENRELGMHKQRIHGDLEVMKKELIAKSVREEHKIERRIQQ